MSARWNSSMRWLAATLLLLLAVGAAPVLTQQMSLHMLVQIPLLLAAGVLAEQANRHRQTNADIHVLDNSRWTMNEYGVPGLILVSLAAATWMIPKALDDALVDWRVAALKYIGMPLVGWLLGTSMRRAPTIVKVFFVGNFCWMSAVAGIIYLEQPVRLCNAYLLNDQDWTGRGLIAVAILIPLGWLASRARALGARANSCTNSETLLK